MRNGFNSIPVPVSRLATILFASLLISACGGGGGGNSADITPRTEPPLAAVAGPDNFLLFPNPQVQADGSMQTNTATYQQAYYAAIDPTNARDTLAKWKATNGFDTGSGEQISVVFGDKKDLGYGRRMIARRNADGTLAFFVENYLITVNGVYGYSTLNLDAAVVRDTQWIVGVNAIEFSPGPNGGAAFPKFYNFKAGTFERAAFVDLDGRGEKAMPGPCITCHGGRGDALTPPDATGKPRFNLVQNGVSQARGDVQEELHEDCHSRRRRDRRSARRQGCAIGERPLGSFQCVPRLFEFSQRELAPIAHGNGVALHLKDRVKVAIRSFAKHEAFGGEEWKDIGEAHREVPP